jgi:hypothetical protein
MCPTMLGRHNNRGSCPGRMVADPGLVASGSEVSERLVGSAAFKAVGTSDPRPAGSIPVHLRCGVCGRPPTISETPLNRDYVWSRLRTFADVRGALLSRLLRSTMRRRPPHRSAIRSAQQIAALLRYRAESDAECL